MSRLSNIFMLDSGGNDCYETYRAEEDLRVQFVWKSVCLHDEAGWLCVAAVVDRFRQNCV